MLFQDRNDAGKQLSTKLENYKNKKDVIVLGLPRGGVVVAHEVAQQLNVPLDIIVARKIGAPGNPELAIGAVTPDGQMFINRALTEMMFVKKSYIDAQAEIERQEAQRRFETYRGSRPPLDLKNKIVILVDDGIATGATMRAAIISAQAQQAQKVIVAVPVLPLESVREFKTLCDELVYVDAPEFFAAVGQFYRNFAQTEDEDVVELLGE